MNVILVKLPMTLDHTGKQHIRKEIKPHAEIKN